MNWRKVVGDFYNSFKQDVERAEEMEIKKLKMSLLEKIVKYVLRW